MTSSSAAKNKVEKIIDQVCSAVVSYEDETIKLPDLQVPDIKELINISQDKLKSMTQEDCSMAMFEIKKYCLSLQRNKNRSDILLRYLKSKKQEAVAIRIKDLVEEGIQYSWGERTKIAENYPGVMEPLNQAIRDVEMQSVSYQNLIERIDDISKVFLDRKLMLIQKGKIVNDGR